VYRGVFNRIPVIFMEFFQLTEDFLVKRFCFVFQYYQYLRSFILNFKDFITKIAK